jgi:hypothetical protein
VPAQLSVALIGEQLEIVDPSRRRGWWELALGVRMDVTADHDRHRELAFPWFEGHLSAFVEGFDEGGSSAKNETTIPA